MEHDAVFWLGDFNYRLSLDYEAVMSQISNLAWLYKYDQLHEQIKNGLVFQGFSEGKLTFSPTYKYDNNSVEYDTSEKRRTPSWTDRILYQGKNVQQLEYNRAELLMSDHRPVLSLFKLPTLLVDTVKRDLIYKELLASLVSGGTASSSGTFKNGIDHGKLPNSQSIQPKQNIEMLIDFSDPAIPPMGKSI